VRCAAPPRPCDNGTATEAFLATLVIHEGGHAVRVFLLQDPEVVIGRDFECDLVLADDGVGERHAVVRLCGGKHVITDQDSDLGTLVNGEPRKVHVLRPDDRVQIGRYCLEYVADGAGTGAAPDDGPAAGAAAPGELDADSAASDASHDGEAALDGGGDWHMNVLAYRELVERQGGIDVGHDVKHRAVVISEDERGQSWKPGDSMTFGHEGVPVKGIGAGAEIVWDGSTHVIKQVGWRPCVSVNGQTVQSHVLGPGDHFQIGKSRFRYEWE
jgi:pSer/pThr/pTyr-binding forkhead associated (FHA) protein